MKHLSKLFDTCYISVIRVSGVYSKNVEAKKNIIFGGTLRVNFRIGVV